MKSRHKNRGIKKRDREGCVTSMKERELENCLKVIEHMEKLNKVLSSKRKLDIEDIYNMQYSISRLETLKSGNPAYAKNIDAVTDNLKLMLSRYSDEGIDNMVKRYKHRESEPGRKLKVTGALINMKLTLLKQVISALVFIGVNSLLIEYICGVIENRGLMDSVLPFLIIVYVMGVAGIAFMMHIEIVATVVALKEDVSYEETLLWCKVARRVNKDNVLEFNNAELNDRYNKVRDCGVHGMLMIRYMVATEEIFEDEMQARAELKLRERTV